MRLLDLRGNVFWFKRDIPAECRAAFDGKRTYLVNLRTGDPRTAKSRRDELEQETRKLFQDIREGHSPRALSARDHGLELRKAWQDASPYSEPGEESEQSIILDHVEATAGNYRGHDRREFDDAFGGRVPVDEYLSQWIAETGFAPNTVSGKRAAMNRFMEWCDGEGHKLPDIGRRIAGQYVSAVIQPMNQRTARNHLATLKGYFDWLGRRGHVDFREARDNPFSDQYQPQRGRRGSATTKQAKERPFTTDEVKNLLYGVPTGRRRNPTTDAETRLITTIGLLSGMRRGEIVTLQVRDVIADAGDGYGMVFDITESKTEAGVRKVPVHPTLVPHIERLMVDKSGRKRGAGEWLFKRYAKLDNPGSAFGQAFKSYRRALGVEDMREGKRRSLVNFHSCRRWFATEAERAGQLPHIISLVVGHEEGRQGQTLGTYSEGGSGAQRRICVEAVGLPSAKRQDYDE